MRLAALFLPLWLLSACAASNDIADALARERAKTVVNEVIESRLPGVNAAPVTDCIIDAASAGEILSIAGATVTGINQNTVEQVLAIAERPYAVRCITENSLTLLGG